MWSALAGPGKREAAVVGMWWALASCNSTSNPGSEHLNHHLAWLKLSFYVVCKPEQTSERDIFFRVLFHVSPFIFHALYKRFFIFGRLSSQGTLKLDYLLQVDPDCWGKKPATYTSLKDVNCVLKLTERKVLLVYVIFAMGMATKTFIMALFCLFSYQWQFLNCKSFRLLYIQKEIVFSNYKCGCGYRIMNGNN